MYCHSLQGNWAHIKTSETYEMALFLGEALYNEIEMRPMGKEIDKVQPKMWAEELRVLFGRMALSQAQCRRFQNLTLRQLISSPFLTWNSECWCVSCVASSLQRLGPEVTWGPAESPKVLSKGMWLVWMSPKLASDGVSPGPRRHSVGRSLGHHRVQGHSQGHSQHTSGPKGPRDSCWGKANCLPQGLRSWWELRPRKKNI